MWFVVCVVVGLWVLCGAPTPDPPTRDARKRLKRQARRKLCYGRVATIERDVYGGVWTHPETGAVALALDTERRHMRCGMRCNAHRW